MRGKTEIKIGVDCGAKYEDKQDRIITKYYHQHTDFDERRRKSRYEMRRIMIRGRRMKMRRRGAEG